MIKVERNITQEASFNLKVSDGKYFRFFLPFKKPIKNEFLNFSSEDFLGLNEKFNAVSLNNSTEHNVSTMYSNAIFSLKKIFNANISLFSDEAFVHKIVLQDLIAHDDFIVLDECANPNLKIAVKSLNDIGIPVGIIQNNSPEKLEEIIINRKKHHRKIWFAGQSIYPVPGKYAPLQSLKKLLEKYRQVHLFLDDAYSLGWVGSSGQGIVCNTFPNMERVVMVAALTKGFGSSGGAVAVSGINSECFGREIPQQGLKLHKLNSISHAAGLYNSEKIRSLQMQLGSRINHFHKLIKGHLPCVSDPSLPICFIATGLPEISHEICSSLIKEGIYISSALYPHSSIHQPGIKINITLKSSDNDIRTLACSLRDVYQKILRRNNKTISQF